MRFVLGQLNLVNSFNSKTLQQKMLIGMYKICMRM